MKNIRIKIKRIIKENYLAILVVLLFALLHLPGIKTPPIDEHNWRQTDTAAVARNFQFESPNIFLPRIDIRGQFSGITGMEFPAYNYILYITNEVFGYQHWHGRIITLFFGCVGLAFFYGFIKRRYSRSLANFSVSVLALLPVYFIFSKNIQPDIMMVSFLLASLYYAQVFTQKHKDKYFYLMLATLALAVLIKIPSIFIVIPICLILGKKVIIKLVDKKKLIIFVLIFVVPVLGWYLWSDYLSKSYGLGNYFYGNIAIADSLTLAAKKGFWRVIADYSLPLRFPFGALYLLGLIGVVYSLAKKNLLPLIWLLSFIFFIGIFAIKSFYHNYYILPLLPPLALTIGIALDFIYKGIKKENKMLSVVFVSILAIVMMRATISMTDYLYKPKIGSDYANLELISDKYIPKNNLIITNANVNPVILYFTNRKGWSLPDSMLDELTLDSYIKAGAKFIVIDKSFISSTMLKSLRDNHSKIYEDKDFIIFSI